MAANSSKLLDAIKDLQYQNIMCCTVGVCCLPMFCSGAICLGGSVKLKSYLKKYKKVVDLYGGRKAVKELSARVHHEQSLFRAAATAVNSSVDASKNNIEIQGDMTLLSMICSLDPRAKSLYSERDYSTISSIFCDHDKYKEYATLVNQEYVSRGGDASIVLYGIMEYILLFYNPTCLVAEKYLDNLVTDTALRADVLMYMQVK